MRAALAALATLFVLAVAAGADTRPAPGAGAPELALGDQHGAPFRLADALRQRRFIVVAFYVKAFTGG